MTWTTWVPVLVAAVAAIPASRSWATIRHDRAMGIRTADRDDREQASTAADRHAARLEVEIARLAARVAVLEAERTSSRDYIDELRAHIYARRDPPPPPRPTP